MWSQWRRELRRLELRVMAGTEDFVRDYQEAEWEITEYV